VGEYACGYPCRAAPYHYHVIHRLYLIGKGLIKAGRASVD